MPSVGGLFYLLVCLVQHWCHGFVISYYTLFCLVFLLSQRSLMFLNKRQKKSGPYGRGGEKELQGAEGGETRIRIHCIREETIFSNSNKETETNALLLALSYQKGQRAWKKTTAISTWVLSLCKPLLSPLVPFLMTSKDVLLLPPVSLFCAVYPSTQFYYFFFSFLTTKHAWNGERHGISQERMDGFSIATNDFSISCLLSIQS